MSAFDLDQLLRAEDLERAAPTALDDAPGDDLTPLIAALCRQLAAELDGLAACSGLPGIDEDRAAIEDALDRLGRGGLDVPDLDGLLQCLNQLGAPGFASSLRAWLVRYPRP